MIEEAHIAELQAICPGAAEMTEAGLIYVFLPKLKLPEGCSLSEVEALLCLSARDGYPTRLFLSAAVAGKGNNWRTYRILDRTWHSWSWKDVSSSLRPAQILLGHLDAFR